MDDLNCNANDYSAFLEGVASKQEMLMIMKKMMKDSMLIMALNLAASVSMMDPVDDELNMISE